MASKGTNINPIFSILGFAHIMAYVECGGVLCFACITGIVASKAYGSYRCQHRSLPMPCIHRYFGNSPAGVLITFLLPTNDLLKIEQSGALVVDFLNP